MMLNNNHNNHIATLSKARRSYGNTNYTVTTDDEIVVNVVASTSNPPGKKFREYTNPTTKDIYNLSTVTPSPKPQKDQYKDNDLKKKSLEMNVAKVTKDRVKLEENPMSIQGQSSKLRKEGDYEQKDDKTKKVIMEEDEEAEKAREVKKVDEMREVYEKNIEILNKEIKEMNTEFLSEKEDKDLSLKPNDVEILNKEIREMNTEFLSEKEDNDLSLKQKETKKNLLSYDFLGGEVDRDEAEALEALNSYWLKNIARKASKSKNDSIREQHKAFYSKYCNGTHELCVEIETRLMSLPHVIRVILKSKIPKIEVIVSDIYLALKDSPELRGDDFEVTEVAIGMRLF